MLNISTEKLNLTNPLYAYVGAFVDELQRAGIHHAVICPGSRSTPLAITLASHTAIHVWMHVDERSAAFFALGLAKRLAQPVALLCTSGTAAANFLPAIAEARLTHVPLLVLTSDRPHELRDNGAPQAIDQNRLYGTHVKWFVEVALPEANNAALRYIRTLASRAAALTQAIPTGPVHLNLPFREPLTPDPLADQPLPPPEQRDPLAWQGRPDNAPYTTVSDAPLGSLPSACITQLAERVSTTPHGLIIVGPLFAPALTDPLLQLAHRLGYPILADPLSQLRCGQHDRTLILSSYDAFLRLETFTSHMIPQLVLRFGAMPTAKPLLLYLKHHAATCQQIIIDGQGGWEEPTQLATEMLHTDPVALCHALLAQLNNHPNPVAQNNREIAPTTNEQNNLGTVPNIVGPDLSWPHPIYREGDHHNTATTNLSYPWDGSADPHDTPDREWLTTWLHTDHITRQALQTAIQKFPQPFEGRIFTELAQLLPDEANLYVGNSMPVRDLDTFFWGNNRTLHLIGNRGANGIDGVISSALGFSAASAHNEPTVLVIGDLSFFHDQNGLLAACLHQLNLVIVLVNNDGGGIFSFLPQAAHPQHFEQLFGTPTGLDFRPIVQMYGGNFKRAESWSQFRQAINHGIISGGLHVVEVTTERASNVQMHRQLWQTVDAALSANVSLSAGTDLSCPPSQQSHPTDTINRSLRIKG
jgi:2-succinyl-5-enolpyruvyl-6-hydroxy-3-cyclohexene-1-carboxylate synthase